MSLLAILTICMVLGCFATGHYLVTREVKENADNDNTYDQQPEDFLLNKRYIATRSRKTDPVEMCLEPKDDSHSKREDSYLTNVDYTEYPEDDSGVRLDDHERRTKTREINASLRVAREKIRTFLTNRTYISFNKLCEPKRFTDEGSEIDFCRSASLMKDVLVISGAIITLNEHQVTRFNNERANFTRSHMLQIVWKDAEHCLCKNFIELTSLGFDCDDSATVTDQTGGSGEDKFRNENLTNLSEEECFFLRRIEKYLTRIINTLNHAPWM